MRHISIVSGVFVSLTLLIHPSASAEAAPDIVINEVQIEGANGAKDEFIRLFNNGGDPVNLSGFKLTKKAISNETCKEQSIVSTTHFNGSIEPKGAFLISHPEYKNKHLADLDYSSSSYYLTDNTAILLYDANGNLLDRKVVGNACDIAAIPSDPESIANQTPPTPDLAPATGEITIRINEIFPNPKEQGDAGEFIELHNIGDTAADISGFVLRDASKTGKYVLPTGTVIAARSYLTVSRAESGLSLNNTDETVSLSDPSGNPVDLASYGTTKEEASYSHDGSSFRWSRYLTPGAPNQFGDAPSDKKTVIPEKAYKNVPATFSASGSDGRKYFWNFGDGDTSRKQEAVHTYEESGTYSGTLTISKGIEETVKAFTVDVGKFPERKVSITALSANPTGDDASSEWISLKNKDKKKIDLLGWSIATGSNKKRLSDHPIRESFVLKPGEERALTREIAAFSLPNGKGHVELRQPDGKVLAKTSYEKERGVKENEVWRKKDGGAWEWILEGAPATPGRKPVTKPIGSEVEEPEVTVAIPPAPETPRTITLDDLSPEDRVRLEAQAEEKVRRRIFAELLDDGAMPEAGKGVVLGASDERRGGYSGTIFRTINQALNGVLSDK